MDHSRRFRWIDGAVCLLLFLVLLSLRPAIIDGDGMDAVSRAVERGFLEGMEPKHAIIAPLLRPVHLALVAMELDQYALRVFSAIDHLATLSIYLVLARGLFPRFVKDHVICRICAIGTVASYGILSRGVTIETYALALLADISLVTYCLAADLQRFRSTVIIALLAIVAVAMHITDIFLAPLIIVLIWMRTAPQARLAVFARVTAFVALGGIILLVLLMIGKHATLWPPDIARILPQSDPQPAQSVMTRVGRAVYGMVRTLAFLPPSRRISASLAIPYAIGLLAGGSVVFLIARRSMGTILPRTAWPALLALVVPFTAVGVAYFPSDPERWLFFLPALWLGIGMAWDRYEPTPASPLGRREASLALSLGVCALLAYNSIVGLLPEARGSRLLEGIKHLARVTTAEDLVISPSGSRTPLYRYYINQAPKYDNAALVDLAAKHPQNEKAMLAELDDIIQRQFRSGGRVFVYNFYGENHHKSEGYPWAHLGDYGPETFATILDRYRRREVVAPSQHSVGLYELLPPVTSATPASVQVQSASW